MHKPSRPYAIPTAIVLALALAGCVTVGPDYQRPALDVPASLAQATANGTNRPVSPVDLLAWWKTFQDPELDDLLAEAAANSQDLVLAAGRIEEARAGVAIADANRYPAVDAYGNATRSRASENSGRLTPGASTNSKDFQLGLTASYEIDFWGKFRRADEAARARLLAQEDNRGVVLSSLYSTLAQNYFALRSYDAQLALADSALATRQENLRLQQRRFSAGSIGELDLHQAEGELAATEVTREQARQLIATTESAIALLAGRTPRDIASPQVRRGASIADLYARMVVPADLPADLLNQRPDILAAEQALRAANADIGQARAQYFPSLRLTGSAGYESNALRDLINPASLLWNLGAGLAQPVFRAGAIGALVSGAEARRTQAEAQYVQSVQGAFRDVHDALVAQSSNDVIYAASTRRTTALQDTLRLATLRYNNGYSSYLEVLTAQRDLLQTQSTLIDVQRAHLSATVGLYRAVGGGWNAKL
jgi:multidrug efflux system outer membrane protein